MIRMTTEEYAKAPKTSQIDNDVLADMVAAYAEEQNEMIVYWLTIAVNNAMRFVPTSMVAGAVARIYQLTTEYDSDVAERFLNDLRMPLDDTDFTEGYAVPKSILALQDKILEAISAL